MYPLFNYLYLLTLRLSHKGSFYWKQNARKVHAIEISAWRQLRHRKSNIRYCLSMIFAGEFLNLSMNKKNIRGQL